MEKSRRPLPYRNGYIMSIRSVLGCFEYLKGNVQYVVTSKFNQDCLENLFSQIRELGLFYEQPQPSEFKHRLRLLILGKNTGDIPLSNAALFILETNP